MTEENQENNELDDRKDDIDQQDEDVSENSGMSVDDEMAAAMGQEGAAMDQSDIDDILGDKRKDHSDEPTFATVEEQMIYMSMLNYEKLPMLDVIFERLILSLTNSLKSHTSAVADVNIKMLEYTSYQEATGALPIPGLLSVVRARPWDSHLIVGMDARLLYAALEIMLGGRKAQPAKTEGRNFTSIERKIGASLTDVILKDLKDCFAQLTEVDFEIERTETSAQFATISQATSPCIHVTMEVTLDSRKGNVDFIIPYATIEPVRKLLSKVFFGEKLGGDQVWRTHLTNEVEYTNAPLQAILHEIKVPLEEVLAWKTGDTLDLRIDNDHEAIVSCAGKPLMKGVMGQKKNDSLALRVTGDLYGKQEVLDDLRAD
ncbi:FliM/FliN family flagellar motor switch protein [Sulfitobacter sp. R18_1]|uniref:FliM/FliN family flagellar motor switch protein n=1 Tax=Sulfitobacter sp. R18_1 TaxID=2821104 RepID=UPI001ADA2845|nr:FliM/FliN family flagellar motor switch protein [Sulfitobacter sp. R18_1]MBO9428619.1 FliM/FliN family flagellar motor switch protein [Sulfitobacter sp. R18_1]